MNITSKNDYERFLTTNFTELKVLVFTSDMIPLSTQFSEIIRENLEDFIMQKIHVAFVKDDFEGSSDIFNEHCVELVPSTIILNANFTALQGFKDMSPAEVLTASIKLKKKFESSFELETIKYKQTFNRVFSDSVFILFAFLKDRLKEYDQARLLLDSKGLAVRRQTAEPFKEFKIEVILAHLGFYFKNDYAYFFNHPCPLVFFHKNLVSDLKSLEELIHNNKDLIESLRQSEEKNVKSILNHNKVLLFVNSDDSNYHEQAKVLKALQDCKVMYSYLDVATKPSVVGILKDIFKVQNLKLALLVLEGNQLVQHEELLLNIDTKFASLIKKEYVVESVDDRIKLILNSAPIVVFIKGTPEFPQCGFTRQLVELMTKRNVKFGYYNILADTELRERLRTYSSWETYPQIYVKSELIGGLDIVKELVENGEFESVFSLGINK